MADQPKTTIYSEFEGTAYVSLLACKVNTNDTITLIDYTGFTTVLALRKDTGASITTTVSSNIITFTSAGMTNVYLLVLVWGQRQ